MFSKTEEEHLQHLETIVARRKSEELYVARKKCEFMTRETEFLGLLVGSNGIKVNLAKAKVISSWPKPTSLTDLISFIGLLQFFCRLMKGFSARATALTAFTRKGMGIRKWVQMR